MTDVGEFRSGVVGNERLTGMAGAALFFLLAAEGVTILSVHTLIGMHIFIGMIIVSVVLVKTTSTLYRIVRYYSGNDEYVRRGAPPLLLRALGPAVIVLTLAVLATGIALGVAGRGSAWLLPAHKASFILWFAAMTVHVVGHILDTPRLALADARRDSPRVWGAGTRLVVIAGSVAFGILLALATRSWGHTWR